MLKRHGQQRPLLTLPISVMRSAKENCQHLSQKKTSCFWSYSQKGSRLWKDRCLLHNTAVERYKQCGRSILWHIHVACCGEADPPICLVIGCVILTKEWVTEDEEGSIWRWYIQWHEGHLAAIRPLVNIILRLQVQDVVAHDEAKVGEALVIRTI